MTKPTADISQSMPAGDDPAGRPGTSAVDDLEIQCPHCGYSLRGISSSVCPECGHDVDWVKLAQSQIPWVHRREIGFYRAYWQTVSFVMLAPRRFHQELQRPVSFEQSQSFRWLTVLCAYSPALAVTLLGYVFPSPGILRNSLTEPLWSAVWPMVVLQFLCLALLAGATGWPSYFFHPKSLPVQVQNRAVALSYYTAGPLAWSPVIFLLVAGLRAVAQWIGGSTLETVALLLGFVAIDALPLLWLASLMRLRRRAVNDGPVALALMGVTILTGWLLLGMALLGVVPLLIAYYLLVFSALG